MVKVDPEWWKMLFDETYLITDARTVCDDQITCGEVDFLEETLKLEKSWPILDLCGGQGRHALELSRRGFRDVTVVDYSQTLIDLGRRQAQEEGLGPLFICKDARQTGLPSRKYKVIIIMASSFGYFVDEAHNQEILREAFRLLMPNGCLLLDLPNREYVLNNFSARCWHEADAQIVVCRDRTLAQDIVYCREVVLSKTDGLIRDATYCTRLYSPEAISALLKSAGFESVKIRGDFASHLKNSNYGLMTNRMIVMAKKTAAGNFYAPCGLSA